MNNWKFKSLKLSNKQFVKTLNQTFKLHYPAIYEFTNERQEKFPAESRYFFQHEKEERRKLFDINKFIYSDE